MARTDDQARELSRRARDDLIRYGIVSPQARPIRLAGASRPAPGDLVMARRNTRAVQAGPGRPGPGQPRHPADRHRHRPAAAAEVRRLPGHDPDTGQARWSEAVRGAPPLPGHATPPSRTRPPSTPPRAAPSAPRTSWSMGSATGRDSTWR